MKEQNTDTLSLKLCMPHQAPLTLKFFKKAISSTYDEVALIKAKTGN
jgi:hypothetical protein